MHAPVALVLLLASLVAAASNETATCGTTVYGPDAISDAASAACNYVSTRSTAGSSTYPHRYKNFEGFKFKGLTGPFYEFPILPTKVYDGGRPGADRVIITNDCSEAGLITHQGAKGNSFVACETKKAANGTDGGSSDKDSDTDNADAKKSDDDKSIASSLAASSKSILGIGLVVLSCAMFA